MSGAVSLYLISSAPAHCSLLLPYGRGNLQEPHRIDDIATQTCQGRVGRSESQQKVTVEHVTVNAGGVAMETNANLMHKAHNAPRCHAKAKAMGNRCKARAKRGWQVCRMHGAGGGAPTGPGNGAWQHGGRSAKAEQSQRYLMALVKRLYSGKVVFHDGDAEVADGVTVHRIGGHSRGLQAVRVRTSAGWLVLASDVAHFYENFQKRKPFPIVVDLQDMLDGFNTLERLASRPDLIVPGHDPLVMQAFPQDKAEHIVRLDQGPILQQPR